MVPGVSGVDLCKEMKSRCDTKVMMLTARTTTEDEIHALKLGADDYIRKPFDPRILILRAKKLIEKDKIVVLGELKIDFQAKQLYKHGKTLKLRRKV